MSLPGLTGLTVPHRCATLQLISRVTSTRAQSVILEAPIDQEAPTTTRQDVDLIGPPDSQSNLRPIIRRIRKSESRLQERFRTTANDVQQWNQSFWAQHNRNFIIEKQEYIKENTDPRKPRLNADEMSEFYKQFLNRYWKLHVQYNFQWYRKNFTLLQLALRVQLEKQLGT